jgi:hypothetical protein
MAALQVQNIVTHGAVGGQYVNRTSCTLGNKSHFQADEISPENIVH